MTKAHIVTKGGTKLTIEGTADEVALLWLDLRPCHPHPRKGEPNPVLAGLLKKLVR